MKLVFKNMFLITLVALYSQHVWSAGVIVEERRIGAPSNVAPERSTYVRKQESVPKTVDVTEADTHKRSIDLNLVPSRPIQEVKTDFSAGSSQGASGEGNTAWNNYELMEDLRREVATLRSLLEEANNRIDRLEKRQKDIYLDLDARLNQVGSSQAAASAPVNIDGSKGASATNAATPGLSAADKAAYKKKYLRATTALQSGRVVDAKKSFVELIERYPSGEYAPNCHYWLGQIASSDTPPRSQDALVHYKTVIDQFPTSGKVSASLFKLGKAHYELKQYGPARSYFDRLVKDFPEDKAASLAKRYLKELNK